MKPLIVWDFDDVLFPLTEAWFAREGRTLQTAIDSYDGITENPPHALMKLELDTYLESLDNFRNSDQARQLQPREEIAAWFSENGTAFRHRVLTARPLHTLDAARDWLEKHFKGYFEAFGFVPAARKGHDLKGYYPSKYEYLRGENLEPDFFIDDKTATIAAVSRMPGVTTILYPAPWNDAWRKPFNLKQLIPGS